MTGDMFSGDDQNVCSLNLIKWCRDELKKTLKMLERSWEDNRQIEKQKGKNTLLRYMTEQTNADQRVKGIDKLFDWERPKNINKNSSSHIGHATGNFIVPIRLSHAQIFVEYVLPSFGVSVILNISCEDGSVVTAASVSISDASPVIRLKYTRGNHHYGINDVSSILTIKATEDMINRGSNQESIQPISDNLFSIETEGQGDCFFIALFFGIAYAQGTPWIIKKFEGLVELQPDFLKATKKGSRHLLLSLPLCNFLRERLFRQVLVFESQIKKHVLDQDANYLDMDTELCDGDLQLLMARQYIQDQYVQDVDSFPDGIQIWSPEFLDKVFDMERENNLNHKMDANRLNFTAKSKVLCFTHVQLAILEVLPSLGIYVDLDIFHCDLKGALRYKTNIRPPTSVRCLLCVDC